MRPRRSRTSAKVTRAARSSSRPEARAAAVLFTPERHEPLAGHRFSEDAAREAIARIVERAARELDRADGRWPLDREDARHEEEPPASDLYCGAAGVAWALAEL